MGPLYVGSVGGAVLPEGSIGAFGEVGANWFGGIFGAAPRSFAAEPVQKHTGY
jgi:hypothetical protein